MDAPDLDEARHLRALRALARINALSLAARRVWTELRTLPPPVEGPIRVLDVACGGGDVAIAIKNQAEKEGLSIEVEGCDISPVALGFAKERARERGLDVEFFQRDVMAGPLPGGFDLVCSSLFLHHLSDQEAVVFFGNLAGSGRATLVQDLLRTHLGYLLAMATVRVVTRSRVVRMDGPLSVRAAFSLSEVESFAQRAGLLGARVERCWPERFTLFWEAP